MDLRVVLLACLIAHVGAAVMLTRRAHRARGRFRRTGLGLRSFTARTMLVTGLVLLLFIVFHILDLTTGTRPFASSSFTGTTVTHQPRLRQSDRQLRPARCRGVLPVGDGGARRASGARMWTAVNDLGVTGQRARQVGVAIGGSLALAVMVGNMTIPIAVWTGLLS